MVLNHFVVACYRFCVHVTLKRTIAKCWKHNTICYSYIPLVDFHFLMTTVKSLKAKSAFTRLTERLRTTIESKETCTEVPDVDTTTSSMLHCSAQWNVYLLWPMFRCRSLCKSRRSVVTTNKLIWIDVSCDWDQLHETVCQFFCLLQHACSSLFKRQYRYCNLQQAVGSAEG